MRTTNKQRETACETSQSGCRSACNSAHMSHYSDWWRSTKVPLQEGELGKTYFGQGILEIWLKQITKSSRKDVNFDTVIDFYSWCKIQPFNGLYFIRANWKFLRAKLCSFCRLRDLSRHFVDNGTKITKQYEVMNMVIGVSFTLSFGGLHTPRSRLFPSVGF